MWILERIQSKPKRHLQIGDGNIPLIEKLETLLLLLKLIILGQLYLYKLIIFLIKSYDALSTGLWGFEFKVLVNLSWEKKNSSNSLSCPKLDKLHQINNNTILFITKKCHKHSYLNPKWVTHMGFMVPTNGCCPKFSIKFNWLIV